MGTRNEVELKAALLALKRSRRACVRALDRVTESHMELEAERSTLERKFDAAIRAAERLRKACELGEVEAESEGGAR